MKTALRRLLAAGPAGLLLFALASAPARRSAPGAPAVVEEEVVLNVRTLIYHCPACAFAKHCGDACVNVDLSEAKRRRAKPCGVCGGRCRER